MEQSAVAFFILHILRNWLFGEERNVELKQPEPEFFNFGGAQESIPRNQFRHAGCVAWARIFKRLWSPRTDSKEWIPPAYVAWRAGTRTLFLLGA